jgi:hypothetical protein
VSGQPFCPAPPGCKLVAWSGDVSQLSGRLNIPERALLARIKALAQDRNGKRLVVEVIPAKLRPDHRRPGADAERGDVKMIRALVSGVLYDTPKVHTGKSGKPFHHGQGAGGTARDGATVWCSIIAFNAEGERLATLPAKRRHIDIGTG